MPKLGAPSCNYPTGEYQGTSLTNVTLDNSINKNILKSWLTKTSMPTSRYGAASAKYNNVVYVACGYNTGNLNILEAYDTLTDTWSTKTPCSIARANPIMQAKDGFLYLAGGRIGSTPTSSLEVYNISLNTWASKASMPTAVGTATNQIHGSNIHVIGGYLASSATITHQVYNIDTDTWATLASLPIPITGLCSGIIGDKIFCLGGYSGGYLNSNYMYDISLNTWAQKVAMPTARTAPSSVSLETDKTIIVIGGATSVLLNNVEIYDTEQDFWIISDKVLPSGRQNFPSEVVNDTIYTFGGSEADYVGTVNSIQKALSDIYFTTDESSPIGIDGLPTSTAIKYTNPFDLNLPVTLKAAVIATDSVDYTPSDTATFFYTLESQWRLPKYDWDAGDGVSNDDMNRIESNIQYVKTRSLTSSNGWESKIASRSLGTEYINDTGKMIIVAVGSNCSVAAINRFYVDDLLIDQNQIASGTINTLKVEVPAGSKYKVDWSSGVTNLNHWVELS